MTVAETKTDWHAAWVTADERCRQLMVSLVELAADRDDIRREYRRSDTVICVVQSWLMKPKASRTELKSRLEALGVVTE